MLEHTGIKWGKWILKNRLVWNFCLMFNSDLFKRAPFRCLQILLYKFIFLTFVTDNQNPPYAGSRCGFILFPQQSQRSLLLSFSGYQQRPSNSAIVIKMYLKKKKMFLITDTIPLPKALQQVSLSSSADLSLESIFLSS